MSRRLLIIDDDPWSVDQLKREVKPLHWDVQSVGDQESAYRLLVTERFDIALVDICLRAGAHDLTPNAEIGYATIRHLHEHYRSMKIIAVTAYDDKSEVNTNAVKVGAYDFWSKRPDASESLLGKIRQIIEKDEREAQTRIWQGKSHPKDRTEELGRKVAHKRNTRQSAPRLKIQLDQTGGDHDDKAPTAVDYVDQPKIGNVIVGVNTGTIVIVDSGSGQKSGTTVSDINDLTLLKSAEWRKEILVRVGELNPEDIKELYEKARSIHHNRLRPAFRDAGKTATLAEFRSALGDAELAYVEFTGSLRDKLNAVVLPDLTSDFTLVKSNGSSLKEAQSQVEALGNSLLKKAARLVNILEEFKASPEEMLLSAVEAFEGQGDPIAIDTAGLQPDDVRQERFYRKGEVVDAFRNLLTNAVESMNGLPNPRLVLASVLSGGQTAIRISDNGRSIPVTDRVRIFEDGYSTKGSTGFGLSHAKRVFEAHGGSLRLLDSDSGATFEVVL